MRFLRKKQKVESSLLGRAIRRLPLKLEPLEPRIMLSGAAALEWGEEASDQLPVISHQSSVISHQSSVISHQLSVNNHQLSVDGSESAVSTAHCLLLTDYSSPTELRTFGEPVTVAGDLAIEGGQTVTFEQGLTVDGDLRLNGVEEVVFKGDVEVSGEVTIDAAARISFEGEFAVGGDASLTSDEVDFSGGIGSVRSIGSPSVLTIDAHTPGVEVRMGFEGSGPDELDLTDADLAALRSGFDSIVVGDPGVPVTIDSAAISSDLTVHGTEITVATSLEALDGCEIVLDGGDEGVVRNEGTIDVSASDGMERAGDVTLTGQYVGNFGSILARGAGEADGGNVSLRSTTQTLIPGDAAIDVSGGTDSSAGTIDVWSDTYTTWAGTLLARGGDLNGDGGFVEVSSAGGMSLTGEVDTAAPAGEQGLVLFDPLDVTIGLTHSDKPDAPGTPMEEGDFNQFSDYPSNNVLLGVAQLATWGNVFVRANRDIYITEDVTMAGGNILELYAGKSVYIDANITMGTGRLRITANDDGADAAQRGTGEGGIYQYPEKIIQGTTGDIDLRIDSLDDGTFEPGPMMLNRVITEGTLTIECAGALRETPGDPDETGDIRNDSPAWTLMDKFYPFPDWQPDFYYLASLDDLTQWDDLTAETLNLVAISAEATFGEDLGEGVGAMEIAAGELNMYVEEIADEDFLGYFHVQDVDHTDADPATGTATTEDAAVNVGTVEAGNGTVVLTAWGGRFVFNSRIEAAVANISSLTAYGPETSWDSYWYDDSCNTTTYDDVPGKPHHGGPLGIYIPPIPIILPGGLDVPLQTDVGVLTLWAADGGINVDELDGCILNKALAQEQGKTPTPGADGKIGVWPPAPVDSEDDDQMDQFGPRTATDSVLVVSNGPLIVGEITAPGDVVLAVTGADSHGNPSRVIDNISDDLNITGQSLTIAANGEVGMFVTDQVDPLETMVEEITIVTADGGIAIRQLIGATVTRLQAGGDGSDVFMECSSGTMSLDTIEAEDDDVTVKALNGEIVDVNDPAPVFPPVAATEVNITGETLDITGAKGIGGGGGGPIEVDVNQLTATATKAASGIYIHEADGLTSLDVETYDSRVDIDIGDEDYLDFRGTTDIVAFSSAGVIFSFENSNGDVAVDLIDVGTDTPVTLVSSEDIRDHTDDDGAEVVDIIASRISLTAGYSIGLNTILPDTVMPFAIETDAVDLVLESARGGIYVREENSATLEANASTSSTDPDLVNDCKVVVISGGDLTVDKVEALSDIVLTATGALLDDDDERADITIPFDRAVVDPSATVTLVAGNGIGTVDSTLDLHTPTLSVTTASGETYLWCEGEVTVTTVQAGGDVSLGSDSDMTLEQIQAPGHTVALSAGTGRSPGKILDGNGDTLNIIADRAELTASEIGASGDVIETDVTTLYALASGGGVFLTELDDLTIEFVEAWGEVHLIVGGDLDLDLVSAPGNHVKLEAAGAIVDGNGDDTNVRADVLDISAPGGWDGLELEINRLGDIGGGAAPGPGDPPIPVSVNFVDALAITEETLEGMGKISLTLNAPTITVLDIDDDEATLDNEGCLTLRALEGNVVFLDWDDTIYAPQGGFIAIEATGDMDLRRGGVVIVGNLKTEGGDISITASRHITIGTLDTRGLAGELGDVTLTATNGEILDGNGTTTNIYGDTVTLTGTVPTQTEAERWWDTKDSDASAALALERADKTAWEAFTADWEMAKIQLEDATREWEIASETFEAAVENSIKENAEYNAALQSAYTADVVANALGTAAMIVGFVSGGMQAVPLVGDGGADVASSALDGASDIAGWLAWDMNQTASTEGGEATAADIALAQATAQLYAAQLTLAHSVSNEQGLAEATAIELAAWTAATIARKHMYLVRDQAEDAWDQNNVVGVSRTDRLEIAAERLVLVTDNSSMFVAEQDDLELDILGVTFTGTQEVYVVWPDNNGDELKLVGSNGVKTVIEMLGGDDVMTITSGWAEGTGSLFDGGTGYDALVYDHDLADGDDHLGPVTVNLQTPHASDFGGFQNVERFEATNHNSDTLVGKNSTWNITGDNAGNIDGAGVLDFILFENLTSGSGANDFTLGAGVAIDGNLTTGAGADNIVLNAGSSIGGNLSSGAGDDNIVLNAGSSVGGNLDGGTGFDLLDYRGYVAQVIVNRATQTASGIGGTFTGIEKVWGSAATTDTLIGENVDAEWRITGDDMGEMAGATIFEFVSFENLTGGSADDVFVFSDGKIITGVVRGEGGTDAIDMDDYRTHNVAWIADDTGGFSGALQTNEARTRDIDFAGIEDLSGGMTAIMWHFADLMPEFYTYRMPDLLVPSDTGSARIIFTNRGNVRAEGDMVVELYLSADRELDGTDYLIGRSDPTPINLMPGNYTTWIMPINVPPNIPAGDYHYIVHLDALDVIEEISNRNNIEASKTPERVVWRFGKVGEREDVPLFVHDKNGTLVAFGLSGPGTGEILGNTDFTTINVCYTTPQSKMGIEPTTEALVEVNEINFSSGVGEIEAVMTDFVGDLTVVTGHLGKLKLIGGDTRAAVRTLAGSVLAMTVEGLYFAGQWHGGNILGSVIAAGRLGEVVAFGGDIGVDRDTRLTAMGDVDLVKAEQTNYEDGAGVVHTAIGDINATIESVQGSVHRVWALGGDMAGHVIAQENVFEVSAGTYIYKVRRRNGRRRSVKAGFVPGNVSGDVTTRHMKIHDVFAYGGDVSGNICSLLSDVMKVTAEAYYDEATASWVGGNITGRVEARLDIHEVTARDGDISAHVHADGDLLQLMAIHGNITGEIGASGMANVIKATRSADGRGGNISAHTDVGRNLYHMYADGDITGNTDVHDDLGRRLFATTKRGKRRMVTEGLWCGGNLTGVTNVFGDAWRIEVMGQLRGPLTVYLDAKYIFLGQGASATGDIRVIGHLQHLKSQGTTHAGDLRAGSIEQAFFENNTPWTPRSWSRGTIRMVTSWPTRLAK